MTLAAIIEELPTHCQSSVPWRAAEMIGLGQILTYVLSLVRSCTTCESSNPVESSAIVGKNFSFDLRIKAVNGVENTSLLTVSIQWR